MIYYDFYVKRFKVIILIVRLIFCYMLYIESIFIVYRLYRIIMIYFYDIIFIEI